MAGETKSKILVIAASGGLGKLLVEESVKYGHPTFALFRQSALGDPLKAQIAAEFRAQGVTVLVGGVDDYDSLLNAVKQVDIVLSAVGAQQLGDQGGIIDAIKEAGNVKRFVPSDYGFLLDSKRVIEPIKTISGQKRGFRRKVQESGIPYTFVNSNFCGSLIFPTLAPPGSTDFPPRDRIAVYGDQNLKGVFNEERDIATYTILAVDDPRALNTVVYIQPEKNIISYGDLAALWEEKIGKKLERVHVTEEDIFETLPKLEIPLNILLSINYSVFVKGDQSFFQVPPEWVEASELYPHVKYTSVEAHLEKFV
ncbi:hypothetical protein M569_12853 [Genlisea aurea]|uniref:NmrA-like domain-containing protein n=1 Tax=Genlisea aurea TaxID=192259 RepID=S8C582_9LAMI|nr:hypothetical protein M569_12853 [Genlisea aurea]